MVKSRAALRQPNSHWALVTCLRFGLLGLLLGTVLTGLLAWFLPIEVVQMWAYEQAEADEYRQFEAVGRAEAVCWVLRFVAPLIALADIFLLRRLQSTAQFLSDAFDGWIAATCVESIPSPAIRWRTWIVRGFVIGWAMLALGHVGHAMWDNVTSWPYYRFRSGGDVLPNISESNIAVIRYLRQATPPDARIFVASDQKLYFLSYYLFPRRLYHRLHPDSEFVIPQPHQRRRMEAYPLSDIDKQEIARVAPDYILEYFEQPDFVERSRLHDDGGWISFFRQSHRDPTSEPAYLVCLRRVEKSVDR